MNDFYILLSILNCNTTHLFDVSVLNWSYLGMLSCFANKKHVLRELIISEFQHCNWQSLLQEK